MIYEATAPDGSKHYRTSARDFTHAVLCQWYEPDGHWEMATCARTETLARKYAAGLFRHHQRDADAADKATDNLALARASFNRELRFRVVPIVIVPRIPNPAAEHTWIPNGAAGEFVQFAAGRITRTPLFPDGFRYIASDNGRELYDGNSYDAAKAALPKETPA